ncbi:hypothetical protein HRbin17_00200 [bacterium HR17]|uniref:Uncharacterized protein n=1 Tax=Candidatus Fervidibacter japonicus TaxID=2035412 RepID=A0A2H5X956_9BACT|nr:hypothetical protein HRbin17_00200 [bacterium HR17]
MRPPPDRAAEFAERYGQRAEAVGAATHPHHIGVSRGEMKIAILHAREIRRRWTILDAASLVGVSPDRLDEVMQRCSWR